VEVIPVIHNVSSVQRLVDMARLVYGLGFKVLVVTKAYGGAAQSGIPEAYRIAVKRGYSLIILPDLGDAISLLSPDTIYMVSAINPSQYTGPTKSLNLGERTMIVFNGGEGDFTPSEMKMGRTIYIEGLRERIGTIAEASLILYTISFNK